MGIPRSPETGKRTASGAAYRLEVEGLRAVAAVLVAIFHVWLGRVSGGVDVFFVVSGFLITTGLLTQIDRYGTPQIALSWARLINRLLPAALLVLCVVIVGSILFLPKRRWEGTIEEIVASALYFENWLLLGNSVDYLQQNAAASPVQHFWALATQGQFYLTWPLLFAVIAFTARWTKLNFRRLAAAVLLLLFTVSLAGSVWLTQRNQPATYFFTPARVWEFCIGGLLAIFITRIVLPPSARLVAGWAGLLAIVSCGLVLQVSRVFPGYAALWPTLGGALVVAAGTSGSRFGVDRFLGSKPMVYLGGISYGIYLWHFPILVFYRTQTQPEPVGVVAGACIIVAAVVLAALTHRFVEGPVKRAKIGSVVPWRAYAFGALCLVPVAVGLVAWSVMYHRERAEEQRLSVTGNPDYPGAKVFEPGFAFQENPETPIYPGPFSVERDFDPRGEACGVPQDDVVPRDCVIAGEPGMPTIAVVGSSLSAQWLPALQEIATSAGWRVVSYTHSNCPFYVGDDKLAGREWGGCKQWNRNVLAHVKALDPVAVFAASTRYAEGKEFVPDSYVSAWREFGSLGIDVIAVRNNPDFQTEVSDCVEVHGEASPKCQRVRDEIIANPSPIEVLANPPGNVHFVDLTDHFCTETTCSPVIGNVMVYRHFGHITATYARSLAPALRKALEAAPSLSRHVK